MSITKIKKQKKSNLNKAIDQIESYITELSPESYQDIKQATYDLSKAALGAYLSVHTTSEIKLLIEQIEHSMIDESNISYIPSEFLTKTH